VKREDGREEERENGRRTKSLEAEIMTGTKKSV